MASHMHRSLFPIHHFVLTYTHNSKTKGSIRTFYISNDFSTFRAINFLGFSFFGATIGELSIQTRITVSFIASFCVHLHTKLKDYTSYRMLYISNIPCLFRWSHHEVKSHKTHSVHFCVLPGTTYFLNSSRSVSCLDIRATQLSFLHDPSLLNLAFYR